jgi:proteasome accessory factor C
VVADDDRSGEQRTFRIDRFEEWARTGEVGVPVAAVVTAASGDEWFADGDLPTVVLNLDRTARWVRERYPVREEHETGDGLTVRLAVSSEQWLRTLLLRLGSHVDVVEPESWRGLAADAATEVLARYEATTS